jgi:alpha-amylase
MKKIFLLFAAAILLNACGDQPTQSKTDMQATATPVGWMPQSNIYEINVRQYTKEGTFNAFRQHLPRLKEMGVETLWFMPIYPIGKEKRKGSLGSYYSIADYKAVNPEFGTLDDFKALVKEAQSLGMKVILDWVANHTSFDNVWMKDHKDFYTQDSTGKVVSPFDWDDVADLNFSNTAVHDAMIDAMKFWVNECGINGYRCDMAHLVPLDFWKRARKELDAIRPLFWLGETQDTPYFEVFDVIYGWEWLHKMEDYYKGKTNIAGLDTILHYYDSAVTNNKFRLLFTTNHDENSWQGTEYQRMGDAAKAFAVLCATLPGVPLVYSGQEEPLRDHKLKFFDKDEIGFAKYELQDFYKVLLTLKKNHPALAADKSTSMQRLGTSADDKVMAFLRKKDNREVLVVINLSAQPLKFDVKDNRLSGKFKNAFGGTENDFTSNQSFEMLAWDFLVYEK